jgi:hypothetical protein
MLSARIGPQRTTVSAKVYNADAISDFSMWKRPPQ